MSASRASRRPKLKPASLETMVTSFAKSLDPAELGKAVASSDQRNAARIPGLLARSGLVQTMRDDARAARRDAALDLLSEQLRDRHGEGVAAGMAQAIDLIHVAERGYLAFAEELDRTLADVAPERWLWSVINQATATIAWSLDEIDRRAGATSMLDGSVFALPSADGDYRADELMTMIDTTTSLCVRMLAARQGWVGEGNAIVIPCRSSDTGEPPDADPLVRLSEFWEMWRRMETTARFLDCELKEESVDYGVARTMVPTRDAMSWRRLAHVAHEQLTVEIASVFHQLVYREDAHQDAVGIEGPASLMPASAISAGELTAYHALAILLAVDPIEDSSLYLGLTLVEWLRGYSFLEWIALEAGRSEGDAERFLMIMDEPDLLARLVMLGLGEGKARRFISNVTFGRGSLDLIDDPILRLADGRLMLFAALACASEVARVMLSKFSRERVQIGSKGRHFENRLRERLNDWGLSPANGVIRDGREDYDVDVAVRLDRRVFLFECKSRSAFGVDAPNVRRLREWMSQVAAQTRRIADGMRTNPEAVSRLLEMDCDDVEIIPCVVGAVPLQAAGAFEGVFFTDQMALAMFFAMREAGVYSTHRIPGLPPIRQTLFANRLWSGASPTSEDLLRFLSEPPSIAMIGAHLRETKISHRFDGVGTFNTVEMEMLPANPSLSIKALGGQGGEEVAAARSASETLKKFAASAKS